MPPPPSFTARLTTLQSSCLTGAEKRRQLNFRRFQCELNRMRLCVYANGRQMKWPHLEQSSQLHRTHCALYLCRDGRRNI